MLDLLGGKWTMPIVLALSAETEHFSKLCSCIPGLTPRMLSARLHQLMANGLVERQEEQPGCPHYRLTPDGQQLAMLIQPIETWVVAFSQKESKRHE